MTNKQYTNKLVKAGFMTNEESPSVEPVTLGGEYQAINGFYYDVFWKSGIAKTGKYGKKFELLQAERECGYWDLDEYATEGQYQDCYKAILAKLEVK